MTFAEKLRTAIIAPVLLALVLYSDAIVNAIMAAL